MRSSSRTDTRMSLMVRTVRDIARLSTCKRLRVGCLVVTPDLSEILAFGYNGPPAGEPNESCRGVTPCGCVHADVNALVKTRSNKRGLVMILTHSPCEACAGLIINGGLVARVDYLREYRDLRGVKLLDRAGIVTREVLPRPTSMLVGERSNSDSVPDLDRMTPREWAVRTESLPAFGTATARRKLLSVGIDLGVTTAINLLPPHPSPSPWDEDRAAAVASALDIRPFDVVYLAGRRVQRAFSGVSVPSRSSLVSIPHPSGLCRFWNDRAAVSKLRKTLLRMS